MESEQRHYDLRSGSRSRSKTPKLMQSCTFVEPEAIELNYDPRNQSRERSCTPGETRNNRTLLYGSGDSKIKDQNVETVVERKKELATARSMFEGTSKRGENFLAGAKKGERRSERQRAKRQLSTNGQAINREDTSGGGSEKISPRKIVTSDYSSEEGEREDLSNGCSNSSSAHEIYMQAGDWWNVFPKTDYTYSERSECRYEIAPGILAMPNMSRRSIHSNTQEVNCTNRFSHDSCMEKEKGSKAKERTVSDDEPYGSHISSSDGTLKLQYRKMHVEQYRCHREVVYSEPKCSTDSRPRQFLGFDLPLKRIESRGCDITSSVDSDAELEEASTGKHLRRKGRTIQQLTSFTSIIVSWFSRLLEFLKLKTVKRREHDVTYSYQRHGSKWFRISEYIGRFFHYIYLFMVRVLLFDSWLLSRISVTRRWIHRKSPTILWLLFLPLLLLIGSWCLPYLPSRFLPSKLATRPLEETVQLAVVDERSPLNEGNMFWNEDHSRSISEELNGRMNKLEDRSIEQSERILNISEALAQLRESEYVWARYNSEILRLEEGIREENKLTEVYVREIHSIKSQFETLKKLYSELKSCCNARTDYVTNEDFEKRIEMVLADYFATTKLASKTEEQKEGGEAKDEDQTWIEKGQKDKGNDDEMVTADRVREIVRDALKIYDADKTGRVDYALESAGGQIISTRCTQKYDIKTRAFKLLAFTLYHENNNPRTVIQGNSIQPGACWAFQGFPGYILIKLRSSIYVTGFTVEHAPKSILPNGEMRSAPKKFNVWGFANENDSEPVMFGDYEFAASDDSLQYFPVQNTTINIAYEYVELRVHSNHGQLEYTCLYRFRVHGKPS